MSMSVMGFLQSGLGLDITGEWNRIVHVNVGGVTYSCQRKTFQAYQKESVLCKMILEDAAPRAEDGCYVLDRDGLLFRHVLNFLRTSRLVVPDRFDEWDLLLEDAKAYGLPALEEAVAQHPAYKKRALRRSLPAAVFLRWNADGVQLLPPLPMLSVQEGGKLVYQSRVVESLDEAVTILLMTYQMRVETWQKDDKGSVVLLALKGEQE